MKSQRDTVLGDYEFDQGINVSLQEWFKIDKSSGPSGHSLQITYLDRRAVWSSRNILHIWYDRIALQFLNMGIKFPNDKKCNI